MLVYSYFNRDELTRYTVVDSCKDTRYNEISLTCAIKGFISMQELINSWNMGSICNLGVSFVWRQQFWSDSSSYMVQRLEICFYYSSRAIAFDQSRCARLGQSSQSACNLQTPVRQGEFSNISSFLAKGSFKWCKYGHFWVDMCIYCVRSRFSVSYMDMCGYFSSLKFAP